MKTTKKIIEQTAFPITFQNLLEPPRKTVLEGQELLPEILFVKDIGKS